MLTYSLSLSLSLSRLNIILHDGFHVATFYNLFLFFVSIRCCLRYATQYKLKRALILPLHCQRCFSSDVFGISVLMYNLPNFKVFSTHYTVVHVLCSVITRQVDYSPMIYLGAMLCAHRLRATFFGWSHF